MKDWMVNILRIEQMYYFLEAAKTGSFTQAANNLYLQQPSLRKGIVSMEAELGRDLFHRNAQGVTLTKYGEECHARIQQIVDIYESLKQDAAPSQLQHMLQVEMSNNFCAMIDVSMADDLYCKTAKNRNCRINVNDDKKSVIRHVMQGDIDVGFISYYTGQISNDALLSKFLGKNFRLIDLVKINVGVCMRKDHPLARKKKLLLEDIVEYRIIFSIAPYPVQLELLEQEIGKEKLDYTIITNWKLIYKYCLQENSLFLLLECPGNVLEDGLIFRSFDKNYFQHYAAVVKEKETRDAIFDYIKIIEIMLQQFQ